MLPHTGLVRSLLILLLVTGTPGASSAQTAPAQLSLLGMSGESKTLSMTELNALGQLEVTAKNKDGSSDVFRGPALRELMSLIGAPTGHAVRGPSMLVAVVAEAADGYRVAFMLAEVDPQFGARKALLALSQNGQPLPNGDGPLRIVVADEEHHARWIRQVTRLRLVTVGN